MLAPIEEVLIGENAKRSDNQKRIGYKLFVKGKRQRLLFDFSTVAMRSGDHNDTSYYYDDIQ